MKKTVHIPSISCGHCVATIQRELGMIDGVVAASGDADTRMVTVEWNDPADWPAIADVLEEIGYPPGEE